MPDDPKETMDEKPTEPTEASDAPKDESDALSPDAIAKRVAALGGEDELERVAREEEERLQSRRREQKRQGKKGLEAAASKRLAKIGEGTVKRPVSSAVAADDPLMARTAHLTKWVKQNAKVVQWVALAAVVGVGGFLGWQYWQDKKEGAASLALTQAVADERGRIGDPEKELEDSEGMKLKDPRPVFKTTDARRDAALAKYREVVAKYSGTGAAILARLGEGSILLDKHDTDGAIAAFESVKSSPLAAADAEVSGRAAEGIGFAYELKAAAGDKDKNLDLALKAFKDLEQVDAKGFKELGLYHQARCFEAKGDKVKAIELLKDVYGRVTKADDHPFSYLQFVVEDRLRALDPAAVPAKPAPGAGGMGGLNALMGENGQIDMSDPRVRKILEDMQKQMQKNQAGGGPVQSPVQK